MIENPANYEYTFDAPGYAKEDFRVSVKNNTLTVIAEKKEAHLGGGKNYFHGEFIQAAFHRSFTLPASILHENIKAEYKNGILRIIVPKQQKGHNSNVRFIEVS